MVIKKKAIKNKKSYNAHKTSFIDDKVEIGFNTNIWHYSHISSNSIIGNNCSLGQNCFVGSNVKIGNGVKVQNNVSIYEGVEIEDDVFLGPSVVFTNITNPRSFISRKDEFKKTILKKGSSIGANSTIVCGVTVGEYALIGAGTVVTKNTKDFALILGVPGKQIGWVSFAGNRLIFDTQNEAKDLYDNSYYKIVDNQLIKLDR